MNAIFKGSAINDEEVLEALMRALGDIGRVSYAYLGPYLPTLMQITATFIQSDKEKAANLAIEFWTSLFEVDIKQN